MSSQFNRPYHQSHGRPRGRGRGGFRGFRGGSRGRGGFHNANALKPEVDYAPEVIEKRYAAYVCREMTQDPWKELEEMAGAARKTL